MPDPMDQFNWLKEKSVIQHFIDPLKAEIGPDKIIVGEFVNVDKPEYTDLLRRQMMTIQGRLDQEGRLTSAPI